MTTFVVMSFAVGYVTYVMMYADISRPLHRQISNMMMPDNSEWVRRIGNHLTELFTCPYCTGFWVALLVQLVCRYNAVSSLPTYVGIVITGLAMTMTGSITVCLAKVVLNLIRLTQGAEKTNAEEHAE